MSLECDVCGSRDLLKKKIGWECQDCGVQVPRTNDSSPRTYMSGGFPNRELIEKSAYDALSARVRELEAGLKKIYDKSQDNWAAAVADGLLHGEKVAVISD